MKAKYRGTCPACGSEWLPGDPIVRWVGKWTDEVCRDALASVRGRVLLIPGRPRRSAETIKPKRGHTRGIRQVS